MKITLPRKVLAAKLRVANKAVLANSPADIYKCLLLTATEGVPLEGTDPWLTIQGHNAVYDLQQQVTEGLVVVTPGSACVSSDLLTKLVNSLPEGDVTMALNLDNHGLDIAIFGSKYHLSGLPPELFPEGLGSNSEAPTFSLPADVLETALKQVIYASDRSGNRPNLDGVRFDWEGPELLLVATDQLQLALATITLPDTTEAAHITVPTSSVEQLLLALEGDNGAVQVTCEEGKQCQFSTSSVTLSSRVIAEKFAGYQTVLKKMPEQAALYLHASRTELALVLKRLQIICQLQQKAKGKMILKLADNHLVLTAGAGEGQGEETLLVEIFGDYDAETAAGLDVTVVTELLAACPDEMLKMELLGEEKIRAFRFTAIEPINPLVQVQHVMATCNP